MMRIMVADDDRVLSHLLCSLLREHGHDALPAYDAMQAVMLAGKAPPPDAIVLDINMPAGTGIETLKRLKASVRTAEIPVVVLSASADPAAPNRVKQLGAAHYLAKPATPDVLLDAIQRAVGGLRDG